MLEAGYRKQLDVAAQSTKNFRTRMDAQEQELRTLRAKLGAKQELDETIDDKNSMLSEVYKALEAECQEELLASRERSAAAETTCSLATQSHLLHLITALAVGLLLGSAFSSLRRRGTLASCLWALHLFVGSPLL